MKSINLLFLSSPLESLAIQKIHLSPRQHCTRPFSYQFQWAYIRMRWTLHCHPLLIRSDMIYFLDWISGSIAPFRVCHLCADGELLQYFRWLWNDRYEMDAPKNHKMNVICREMHKRHNVIITVFMIHLIAGPHKRWNIYLGQQSLHGISRSRGDQTGVVHLDVNWKSESNKPFPFVVPRCRLITIPLNGWRNGKWFLIWKPNGSEWGREWTKWIIESV